MSSSRRSYRRHGITSSPGRQAMLVAGRGPPLGTARSRCPGPRVSGMGERTAFSLLISADPAKVLARPARAMGRLFRRRARDGRLSSVRMEAGRGVCLAGWRRSHRLPRCPLNEGCAAPTPTLPRLRCRAGLFERHEHSRPASFSALRLSAPVAMKSSPSWSSLASSSVPLARPDIRPVVVDGDHHALGLLRQVHERRWSLT
jgi:hypothetical protein